MQFVQQREPSVDGATLSKLTLDGKFICDICEDIVREVPGQPVESWKVHGQTAIPVGTYTITAETSNRFGPDTLTVNDVPGFVGVRIHGGNTSADTEGCLLPGARVGTNRVAMSQAHLAVLKALINPALKVGEPVTWMILPS